MKKNDFTKVLSALGVNRTEVLAMARTFKADPLQKFNFNVIFSSADAGNLGAGLEGNVTYEMGFQSVGGLSREIGVATYYEAGYQYEHKLRGRQTGGQLTFAKGAYAGSSLPKMFDYSLIKGNTATRFDVTIQLLDREGNKQRSWVAHNCWVSKWEAEDLDATSDDVLIETMTVEYEYLDEE